MSFFLGKDGKISVIRTGLFFALLGGLFVAGAFISVSLEQQSHRAPLDVDLPSNAEQWGSKDELSSISQRIVYRVPNGVPEEVAGFYQQKMDEHYGNDPNTLDADREQCQRFPAAGNYPDYTPENDTVPYLWKCVFDVSSFGTRTTRSTQVTIHPGVPSEDPLLNSEGYVVIEYRQEWDG